MRDIADTLAFLALRELASRNIPVLDMPGLRADLIDRFVYVLENLPEGAVQPVPPFNETEHEHGANE